MEQIYLVGTFAVGFLNLIILLFEPDNFSSTSDAVMGCVAISVAMFGYYFLIFTIAMEMVKSVATGDTFLNMLYKVQVLPEIFVLFYVFMLSSTYFPTTLCYRVFFFLNVTMLMEKNMFISFD